MWQEIAVALIKKYAQRYYSFKKQEYEAPNLEYYEVKETDDNFIDQYKATIDRNADDWVNKFNELKNALENKTFRAVLALEKNQANLVLVSDELSSPHHLIQHTKRCLKSGRVDEKGILRTDENGVLDIQVTKGSFSRSLRIMNALVKAMEKKGYELRPCSPGYYGNKNLLAVWVEGEEIFFGVDKKISR